MRIQVIDSHTGGEPTRVVLSGAPELLGSTMEERQRDLAHRLDGLRNGLVNEPRGSEVLVGAYLTPPVQEGSVCSVVFFNNVGVLGMCGHGTIGLIETLRHLGRIEPGTHAIDTPVGTVNATLLADGEVEIENVPSYRYRSGVELSVNGIDLQGDIAYGGNWFFLVRQPEFTLQISEARRWTQFTTDIMSALQTQGITGDDGAEIDHIELFGPPGDSGNDSKNFVLCPGAAYDRSPCGTGTSAKLACLAAEGSLDEGQLYRQESITGSVFVGRYQRLGERIVPRIRGSAHVVSEATLLFDDRDPLRWGLR